MTRKVPALGFKLTNGPSTQQENAAHKTNKVKYKQNPQKRLVLYDTGVDKGSPREGLTTPALVLPTSTRRPAP